MRPVPGQKARKMDQKTKDELGEEQRQALVKWGASIQTMLDERYGKGSTGHLIVIFPIGRSSKLSWISNATVSSVINVLKFLTNHLEKETADVQKIAKPQGGLWTLK